MPKCREIMNIMEEIAPKSAALSWDNPGLMAGNPNADIAKILVSLDVSCEVIDEAIAVGANMIITHHPLIFKPIKAVRADERVGRILIKLIKNDICLFAAHTNLDVSPIGTNAELAKLLELENAGFLMPSPDGVYAMGRVGSLKKKMKTEDFGELVKKKLGLNAISISKAGDYVTKIGLCTGHGCDREFLEEAVRQGCDGYVSGDIGYHEAQEALAMGISLFDGTHYATETIVTKPVAEFLRSRLQTEVVTSKTDGQTLKFI